MIEEKNFSIDNSAKLLKIDGLSKSFGHVRALSKINVDFAKGKVYGIAGPNGAGKSTLIRILAGFMRPDEGRIILDGKTCQFSSPRDSLDHGIVTFHQNMSIIPTLSVEQNLVLGREKAFSSLPSTYRKAVELCKREIIERDRVTLLSSEDLFFLYLHRLLLWCPRILILDEATTSASKEKRKRVYDILKDLVSNEGLTVLMVSHDLEELNANIDHVLGIRKGEIVYTNTSDTSIEDRLLKLRDRIFGESQIDFDNKAKTKLKTGKISFRVENLIVGEHLPISFKVHEGEILAFLVDEYGISQGIFEGILGWRPVMNGKIHIGNRVFDKWSPPLFRSHKLAWISKEPEETAFLNMSLAENMSYGMMHAARAKNDDYRKIFTRFRGISVKKLTKKVKDVSRVYDIIPDEPNLPFYYFSGGNRQKSILCRELESKPDIILAFTPTRGLDETAKVILLENLEKAAIQNTAIILWLYEKDICLAIGNRAFTMDKSSGVIAL